MKHHSLMIRADNQPTLLERLLQITRYRGYSVTALQVTRQGDELAIELKVAKAANCVADSVNGVEHLYHQLSKLFDVKHVSLAGQKQV